MLVRSLVTDLWPRSVVASLFLLFAARVVARGTDPLLGPKTMAPRPAGSCGVAALDEKSSYEEMGRAWARRRTSRVVRGAYYLNLAAWARGVHPKSFFPEVNLANYARTAAERVEVLSCDSMPEGISPWHEHRRLSRCVQEPPRDTARAYAVGGPPRNAGAAAAVRTRPFFASARVFSWTETEMDLTFERWAIATVALRV